MRDFEEEERVLDGGGMLRVSWLEPDWLSESVVTFDAEVMLIV